AVMLSNGTKVEADIVLIAAGNKPNIEVAKDAGLAVNRGVLVDDHMRTSDEFIYAAGDVAEIDGQVYGLWPIAVDQAQVAARNALGEDEVHGGPAPPALLKGVGVELLSVGRVEPLSDDITVVVDDNNERHTYMKLVASADRRVVGA